MCTWPILAEQTGIQHTLTADWSPLADLYTTQDDHEKDISMCFSAESEQEYQPPGPGLV